MHFNISKFNQEFFLLLRRKDDRSSRRCRIQKSAASDLLSLRCVCEKTKRLPQQSKCYNSKIEKFQHSLLTINLFNALTIVCLSKSKFLKIINTVIIM